MFLCIVCEIYARHEQMSHDHRMTFPSNILDNQSIPYSFLPSILTKNRKLFLVNEIDSLHSIVAYANPHRYHDYKYYVDKTVYESARRLVD